MSDQLKVGRYTVVILYYVTAKKGRSHHKHHHGNSTLVQFDTQCNGGCVTATAGLSDLQKLPTKKT